MTDTENVAIVFTGRQGAGKTVLSRAILNALKAAGVSARPAEGAGENDTLVVTTTQDQRCYLSTGAQVSLGVGRLDVEHPPEKTGTAERPKARPVPNSVEVSYLKPVFSSDEMEPTVQPYDPTVQPYDEPFRHVERAGTPDDENAPQAVLDAVHAVAAQYEDQPAETQGSVQIETALQAIAVLTQKFLPEQDVRTQEALDRAAQDFAKASGKTVVILLDEDAEKWTDGRTKPARVEPKDNPHGRHYVSMEDGRAVLGFEFPGDTDLALRQGLDMLCALTHSASLNAGWYTNPATGKPLERNVPEMMMLIVSEIAEAMEGYRKGLMDDHLPDRLSVEVELADAVIRIGDLCGYLGLDLAGAVRDKMAYNQTREDHRLENRAAGGKSF